jgi:hypothetical protein
VFRSAPVHTCFNEPLMDIPGMRSDLVPGGVATRSTSRSSPSSRPDSPRPIRWSWTCDADNHASKTTIEEPSGRAVACQKHRWQLMLRLQGDIATGSTPDCRHQGCVLYPLKDFALVPSGLLHPSIPVSSFGMVGSSAAGSRERATISCRTRDFPVMCRGTVTPGPLAG